MFKEALVARAVAVAGGILASGTVMVSNAHALPNITGSTHGFVTQGADAEPVIESTGHGANGR
jgi:hypothetical protein